MITFVLFHEQREALPERPKTKADKTDIDITDCIIDIFSEREPSVIYPITFGSRIK